MIFKLPRTVAPAALVFVVCAVYIAVRYAAYQDWMAFVDYDGYYSYFIARWGFEIEKTGALMNAAYRYQRIVYPLLAHILSAGGDPHLVAFYLVVLNAAAIVAGTYVVALLLEGLDINPWYAAVYGLYGGQFLALATSLSEPAAYLFVAMGIYFWDTGRLTYSVASLAVAILTKEVALVFVAAFVVSSLLARNLGAAVRFASAVAPYVVWQIVLMAWLREPALTAGQPFELPLWGWLSGFLERPDAALLLAIVLIPMSYLPMLLLGVRAAIDSLQERNWHPYVLMVLSHVVFMLVLPKATAREPAAMIRITQGLLLAALLYGGLVRSGRILNYSVLWIATWVVVLSGSGRNGPMRFD